MLGRLTVVVITLTDCGTVLLQLKLFHLSSSHSICYHITFLDRNAKYYDCEPSEETNCCGIDSSNNA